MKQQDTSQQATTTEQPQRAKTPLTPQELEMARTFHNHREAFVHFMSVMDVEMVHDILKDSNKFQHGGNKAELAELLTDAFREFREKGDKYLKVEPGKCTNKNCNLHCPGYAFIGNVSGAHLDLIAKGSDTFVDEVFECLQLKLDNGEKPGGDRISIFGLAM